MDRRHFIFSSVITFGFMDHGYAQSASRQIVEEKILLWKQLPSNGGPVGVPFISSKGAVSHIAQPYIQVFRPKVSNGHAVLIAGGGGYKRIEMEKEAYPAAHWLTALGYTAYVLCYRLPGEGWTDGNLVSMQDAQRALRLILSHEKYVSVLGFSAGAHLLGLAVTKTDFASYTPQDAIDAIPIKVRAAALIYPVVTLEEPYTKTSTHRMLVGKNASAEENASWSIQNYVTKDSPACFLVQAEDDAVADPANSAILEQAYQKNGVAVEKHLYASGGHGFGMGIAGTLTETWPQYYQAWLQKHA